MKLLVVRHAIAMKREDFKGKSDDSRPLTEAGISKMKRNAEGLASLVSAPALLVTSPLVRAVQTFDILRETW
ncbi:MAG: phosphoglycerate mutase family protein, partial [Bdellovibrionota bacterium]